MKTKSMITMLVGVAMILSTPIATLGKGKPENPGSGGGSAGDAAGALYGDLYVIERDGNGVPIPRDVTYTDSETGQPVTVSCLQPLAEGCGLLKLWGEDGAFNPEEYDPCAVYSGGTSPTPADLVQTVSFGRGSVSRSPPSVIDSSYAEALKAINLATANCDVVNGNGVAIKQDPAGRIMLCLATATDPASYAWKTIDAPLENLGMYRAAMTDGCLSPIDGVEVGEEGQTITVTTALSENAKTNLGIASLGHLPCADDTILPEVITKADMLSAAIFIGAAADKFYPVNLDQIINLNTYLGVNTYTYQRSGNTRTLTVTYLDFGVFDYTFGTDACVYGTSAELLTYDSDAETFAINSVNVFGNSPPGVALRDNPSTNEVVEGVAITVCRAGLPYGEICDLGTSNTPYDPDQAIGCGGANWFAQAAEDARKTIWYLHNFEAPELAY